MKVETNPIVVYRAYKDATRSYGSSRKVDRCPICGHVLKQIAGSNVQVCVNKLCEQNKSFFELM